MRNEDETTTSITQQNVHQSQPSQSGYSGSDLSSTGTLLKQKETTTSQNAIAEQAEKTDVSSSQLKGMR